MAHAAAARADFQSYIETNPLFGTNGSPANAEQPFTTVDQLRDHWTATRIKQALGVPSYSAQDISTIQKRYLSVFSILVLIGKPDFIEDLIHYPNLDDNHLPFYFSHQHPPQHWRWGREEFELFYHAQWRFCAQSFERELLMSGANFDEERILPFTKEESLESGDSARTCKIKLHKSCHRIFDPAYPNGADTAYFVLKTYYTDDARRYYENEIQAFKRLMHEKRYVENMLIFYGSWKHGDTYNVLLEYADQGTLLEYLHRIPSPTRAEDITIFWTRLFETVRALQRIHELQEPGLDPPLVLQGIHQDIKPANILVFSKKDGSVYDVVFKIADLGLSHFEAKVQPGQHIGARDTYGTPMYSAPECCRLEYLQQSQIPVTPAIDIWSLGCVFSEAAAWAVLGDQGVKDYADLRRSQIPPALAAAGYGDCFHNGTDVLPAVKTMHDRLRRERRISDLFVEGITDTIEMMLESNPRTRYTAFLVFKKCKQIVRNAEDPSFPRPFRTVSNLAQYSPPLPGQSGATIGATQSAYEPQTPPQVPMEVMRTSTHLASQHATPPQSPTESFMQSMSMNGLHQYLPQDNMANLNNLPGGLMSGLNLARSPIPSQTPMSKGKTTPFSQTSSRPLSSDSRRSRVSFAQNPSNLPGPQPRDSSREHWYGNGTNSEDQAPFHQHGYVLDASGAVSVRKLPERAILESPDARHKPKYEHVSVKSALQWGKSSIGSSSPIDSFLNRLEGRDHVFLIDNSMSMKDYWQDVVRVFTALAAIAQRADPDGIDLYFTNSWGAYHGKKRSAEKKSWEKLIPFVEKAKRTGRCDMKEALGSIYERFSTDLDPPVEKSRRSRFSMVLSKSSAEAKPKRGLSAYILTDGVWQDGPDPVCGVEQPIRLFVSKLTENRHLDTKIGIQFIRFGNSQIGMKRLDILDSRLQELFPNITMDIVDTTNYDGNVLKMLLGAFDRHWDDDEQKLKLARSPSQRPAAQPPPNGFRTGFPSC